MTRERFLTALSVIALCARAHFCAGRRNVAYRLDSTAEADERSGRLAQYLIVSLPALCLLSAAALSAIDPRKHGTWVVALCCVASLLRVHVLYRDESSEDWRAAVRYVSSQLRSGDELAFFPVFSKTSFAYYAKRTGLPMPNSGYRKTALGYVYYPTDSARRVWLFIRDSDTSGLARRLSLQRAELGGARVGSERAQFPDIRIELFERGGRPTAR